MTYLNKHRKNVIITDSYSVLQALESKTWGKHYLITKILLLYNSLYKSNVTIKFFWVSI